MSYGWLTESSIIPKKSKKVEVDNTSVKKDFNEKAAGAEVFNASLKE